MREFFFVSSALIVSIIHSLMPEHWIPFILVGRVRKWTPARTAFFTFLAMSIHLLGGLILGFLAFFGITSAQRLGEIFEMIALILLILFGIYYMLPERWTERFHSHKKMENAEGIYLTLVTGMHPCLFITPLFLAIAPSSRELLLAGFALSLPVLCVPPTVVGLISAGFLRARWEFIDRYGRLISGAVILLLGIFLFHHH